MGHLLGIDIGTSGTKTLICDEDGRVLGTAMAEHPIQSPKPGWSEQHPADWWSAVCQSTRAVLKKTKTRPTDISAIGLSGQMHGSVFLGDGEDALRPALLWNDQRTTEECEEIESKAGGRAALIALVANPALTGFTAPKILWVRKHQPRIYARTKHILLPKDYIRFRLTGEYATEVSDASGTLLLDVVNRRWSKQLLQMLEIDPALLPRMHESHEVTGMLTAKAAAAIGLVAGIPVVGGAGDQAAGAVGNGIVAPGIVSATLGHERRHLRSRRSTRARSARPRSHDVSRGGGKMVRFRLHAVGRRQLSMVPQYAGQIGSRCRAKAENRPVRIARG